MADRHPPTCISLCLATGAERDSFLDATPANRPSAGVDPARPLDSDAKIACTDVPERIDKLLPGEAALVYHCLRDRLATLFDKAV